MAGEISKIRCGTNGECHDIKDARARESIAAIEDTVRSLESLIKGITGGSVDAYVTDAELAEIERVITEVNNLQTSQITNMEGRLQVVEASQNTAEFAALIEQVNTNKTDINSLNNNLAEEATARANADSTLQANIDAEATARANADTALQSNIDAEATARANADSTLQANIDAEATARANANSTLQTNIDAEVANRQSGDTYLQNQINSQTTKINEKLSQSAGSMLANGYVKLSNGLIIQWGTDFDNVDQKDYQNGTVTFPTAFSSGSSYAVSAILRRSSAINYRNTTLCTRNLSSTGFGYMWYGESYANDRWQLQWIAIGY